MLKATKEKDWVRHLLVIIINVKLYIMFYIAYLHHINRYLFLQFSSFFDPSFEPVADLHARVWWDGGYFPHMTIF